MVGGDLARPCLTPGEQRRADAAPADGRIDEADLVVRFGHRRSVRPVDPGVPDDPAVELDDQDVRSRSLFDR